VLPTIDVGLLTPPSDPTDTGFDIEYFDNGDLAGSPVATERAHLAA